MWQPLSETLQPLTWFELLFSYGFLKIVSIAFTPVFVILGIRFILKLIIKKFNNKKQ